MNLSTLKQVSLFYHRYYFEINLLLNIIAVFIIKIRIKKFKLLNKNLVIVKIFLSLVFLLLIFLLTYRLIILSKLLEISINEGVRNHIFIVEWLKFIWDLILSMLYLSAIVKLKEVEE